MTAQLSYDLNKEKNEALAAGNRALDSLYAARRELQGARNWGLFDMLGGGMISGIMKHSKMNKAQQYMVNAKYDLQNFSREMRDVDTILNLDFNSADFLTFADFFFDGVIADWLMQDRIHKTRSQVEEAIARVEDAMDQLSRL